MITRREFCKLSGDIVIGVAASRLLVNSAFAAESKYPYIRDARYYKLLDNKKIQCELCPRNCIVAPKRRGYCGVRENRNGKFKTLVYGRLASINNDPIEKKPLFHFLPGTTAISVSTAGCNLKCKFCQNWSLSQSSPEDLTFQYLSPEELVKLTKNNSVPTIAYTYNEPTIFTEYILDTAAYGRDQGIKSVMISAGYINKEPLRDLCKVLDAIKIDFKAFSDSFYKDIVSGRLNPVLDTLVEIKSQGVWLEMVNLIIPTLNDSTSELENMCKWITANLGTEVPLHFTRFHPAYLLKNLPPTPVSSLENAYNIARNAGINYVYVGNVPGHSGENTNCPHCGHELIIRKGFYIVRNKIKNGKCPNCSSVIPGVWT